MVVGAAVEDKETLRHEARRQREQERLKKLGPGRLRSIGADIAGVKNQVEEKKRQDEAEREAQMRADDEDEAIRRYLIQVESEDALAKRKEMVTLRNDWHLQAAERDHAREREARERATPSLTALNKINATLAHDLKKDTIAAVVLHPGYVSTDMTNHNAHINTDESVAGLSKVLDGITRDDAGKFVNYDGSALPW